MAETKDNELAVVSMSEENNTDFDNSSKSVYGETVLCSSDSLNRLPSGIYELWNSYLQEELPSVEPGEVEILLQKWFRNESISELSTITGANDYGQQSSCGPKRRRVDSNV